jgi:hypothetical protein
MVKSLIIRVFSVLFFLHVSLFGNELFFLNDYKKALELAKQENKIVYVLITSTSCQWCRKFEKTTLTTDVVKKKLQEDCILVHLVRDKDAIPHQFKTSPVPRHYFTDFNGNILVSALGFRDVEVFSSFIDNAKHKYNLDKRR